MLVLRYLSGQLFPFNYVVPGQSENSLLPVRKREAGKAKRDNPFSEATYRALHFVVDLPVRIDDVLPPGPPVDGEDLGRIVFSMVEFQVMDEESALRNEQGRANHHRYKKRQAVSALRRLSRGLVVPRKRKAKG